MANGRALVITACLHERRFHGTPEWPPAPARLFQALVAGAAVPQLDAAQQAALESLEAWGPPLIGAPGAQAARAIVSYVPNNDRDSVGPDPENVSKIRTGKRIAPRLLRDAERFLYAWRLPDEVEGERIETLRDLAHRLYQFGRGVDMAWATAEVLADEEALERRLAEYPGAIYRPSSGAGGIALPCPAPGSLASLEVRYHAYGRRFRTVGKGRSARQVFSQPPKPRFVQVAYESPPTRFLFELRRTSEPDALGVWPLDRALELVVLLRDAAARRLRTVSRYEAAVERVLIGRKADGADSGPMAERIRIVPLPSIGHPKVDRGVRRALVEVPSGCPIRFDDVRWAFSGLEPASADGEPAGFVLVASDDRGMLARYGLSDRDRGSQLWRSVTPLALPEEARRRRIDPARRAEEAKGASERALEEERAAAAVARALRHAGVRRTALVVGVQREPFEAKGRRAEDFAHPPRFDKHRLWHVEVQLDGPVSGPLVLGDGRFLGLGLMAPAPRESSFAIRAFSIEAGLADDAEPERLARAFRRAVIARVQAVWERRGALPGFFTGHAADGRPARSEDEPHLSFAFDPGTRRLLMLAPHQLDRRKPKAGERKRLEALDEALDGLIELRAGRDGRLSLGLRRVDEDQDPLFRPARNWVSMTPYRATRHAKAGTASDALVADVELECRRRGLPRPQVDVLEWRAEACRGLCGRVRLRFSTAVRGPIVLGRTRYLGGGLFAAED